ncbi:MAG: serine/threonine-protein kinase [Candidatus Aminicenantes bacterium]|nr:serine/threonine-protein kinase [Candidatus Aminicenantes bacterium]
MTPTDSKKKTKGTGSVRTSGATPKAATGRICPECRTENSGNSRFCSNCAAPMQDTRPAAGGDGPKTVRASTVELARGNRLAGRYEIIEELGRGGMGKVFKAYDHKISEVIALKLIRPEISVQDKAIERFKNELKFTRKITHRNICRMYDLGEEDFIYYITMEYVAGEDLKRFVKRAGPLNAGKAVMIAGQICDGLAEAHRIGAIHRDLKPQNIMIDSDGNAKIMDFGIARFTDMDRMTGSGVMIGTPEYMSPEQAELTEVDARSDIYSLGVVLYEMVTGKVPFEGATPLSLAMKHKLEIPKNVREWNVHVPAGLAAVIAKCLEKDPAKRYQTAEELKTALEGVGRDVPTAEWEVPQKAAPPKDTAPAPAGKRKNHVPLIAAATLMVAAVVAYFLFFKPGPPPETPPETTVEAGPAAALPDAGLKPETKETPKSAVSEAKPEAGKLKNSGAENISAKNPQGAKLAAVPGMAPEERQAVDLAHARMIGARSIAVKEGHGQNSVFFVAAEMLQENGQGAMSNRKGADARCYFTIAEKLLRICVNESSDPARWKALLSLVDDLRESALEAWKGVPADSLFQDAQNRVTRGEAVRANNDLGNAVKEYAVAAFDYEKIRWAVKSALKK